MELIATALQIGLALASLSLGVYIAVRVFNIPDITTDGSFTTGAAVTATLLINHHHSLVALLAGAVAGAIAGVITGIIHTYFKVNALLSGIITMTGLYSINLAIMGKSTVPVMHLLNDTSSSSLTLLFSVFTLCTWLLLCGIFASKFGLLLRATGSNESVVQGLGFNTKILKITGLAMSNGLIAISGGLLLLSQGFADINMGTGIVIAGLAAVMMGEMIVNRWRKSKIAWHLLAAVMGSMLFQMLLSFTISIGVDPIYLKLTMAVFVLTTIVIPSIGNKK
jgi:putative tryptophan/tyrosine transport system permease protein